MSALDDFLGIVPHVDSEYGFSCASHRKRGDKYADCDCGLDASVADLATLRAQLAAQAEQIAAMGAAMQGVRAIAGRPSFVRGEHIEAHRADILARIDAAMERKA